MFEFQKVSFVVLLIATLVEDASASWCLNGGSYIYCSSLKPYCCKETNLGTPYCTNNCLGEYCFSSSNCAKDECCSDKVCRSCNTETNKSHGLASWIIAVIVISVLVSVAIPVAISVWCCCFATSAAARRSHVGVVVSQPNTTVVDQIYLKNLPQANQGPIPVYNTHYWLRTVKTVLSLLKICSIV